MLFAYCQLHTCKQAVGGRAVVEGVVTGKTTEFV